MSPKSRRRTTHGTSERDRRTGRHPHCTGRCRRRGYTCGACSCSWCWSGCWWPFCTSQLWDAMLNNLGLNVLICFVLLAGVLYCLPAGAAALSRDPLGQRLSHRRSGPRHLAPPGPAVADGHHAARPHRLAVAVGHLHALDHGFDRRAARRGARHRPLSGRPAGVPRPARHLLGPARHHPVGRQDHQRPRHPGRRQRRRVRRAEERPGRAAARHGHGLLVLAAGPRRLAGAGLPGAAGQPRPRPLLQSAGGMAVRHHRAGARRGPRPATSPATSSTRPSHDMHRAIADLSERLGSVPRRGRRRRRTGRKPSRSSPRASTSSSGRCAPSRRWCASGSTSRRPSSRRWPPCSRTSPPTSRARGKPWPTAARAERPPTASSGRATSTCSRRCCWSSPS